MKEQSEIKIFCEEGTIVNNKGVGAVFCLISAILTAARYITAAVFMSGVASWDRELFRAGLDYVGPELKTAAVIALVLGAAFLLVGLFQDFRGTAKK